MKEKLFGNSKEGTLFIISAPAGTGKTTLVKKLASEFPYVTQSISFTTRVPRPKERHGVDYFFVSREEFEKQIEDKAFLEHVELYGDYYGTSIKWVEEELASGKHVILVIDTQGALQLKEKLEAVFIFLIPPSIEELKRRLIERNTENETIIKERLKWAEREIACARFYDYKIINADLDTAYRVLQSILIAEAHRADILPS